MELAERVVGSLPIRGRQADWMAALEERHLLADRALGYVELYGAYTETEARYRVDRLLDLWDRMDADDRPPSAFDPAAVDWATYVRDIHLPSIIEHARVRTAPARVHASRSRAERARKAILSPDRHLAAFDLENTLIASNVVDSYAWLASRHLPAAERVGFVADLVRRGPRPAAARPTGPRRLPPLLLPPLRGRAGGPAPRRRRGSSSTTCSWPSRSPPASPGCVEHRALGHRTVLITGALDFVVEPLRPLFDDIVCARLGEVDGLFTGRLEELPPIGEARALVLADYAEAEGLRARGVDGLRRLGQRPAHARGGRASRWRSTPRPSWPPSPGDGAGTSSTGARPTGEPARSCPSVRSTAGARAIEERTSPAVAVPGSEPSPDRPPPLR